MKIVILRHGQAESHAASDFDRCLTELGVEQARLAGQCLAAMEHSFDQVWVSPYCRTRQTAEYVVPGLPIKIVDGLVPESRVSDVIALIDTADVDSLLLVSHQPLVSSLAGALTNPRVHIPMSPASMVLLETDVVALACCELRWLRHAPHFERE